MKIIAIGRNYVNHAREMKSAPPKNPVFFMKPDTAILRRNRPFYYPGFSEEIHYETEVVLKISRNGKHIEKEFASRYYEEVSLGVDFTARDLQRKSKEGGLPWEIAKAFDNSAPLSETWLPVSELNDPGKLDFYLELNDQVVQKGNTADMIFSFDTLISYLSRFVTLKMGDLIFTGTPEGVGPVHVGDRLKGYLEDRLMFDFQVK